MWVSQGDSFHGFQGKRLNNPPFKSGPLPAHFCFSNQKEEPWEKHFRKSSDKPGPKKSTSRQRADYLSNAGAQKTPSPLIFSTIGNNAFFQKTYAAATLLNSRTKKSAQSKLNAKTLASI